MNVQLAQERAKTLGMSRRAIAEELGVSRTMVIKWLNGINEIPSRYVIPLADLLGVTADRLLREERSGQGAA